MLPDLPDDFLFYVQALGFVGFFVSVVRLQMRTTKQMRFFNFVSSAIFSLHYLGLGALPAGILTGISSCRSLLLLHPRLWGHRFYIVGTAMFLSTVVSVYVFERWYDVLPLFGVWVGSLIDWQHCALRVRALGVLGNLIWMTYNFLVGSYGGILNSIVKLCSNGIGYVRHHVLPQKLIKED